MRPFRQARVRSSSEKPHIRTQVSISPFGLDDTPQGKLQLLLGTVYHLNEFVRDEMFPVDRAFGRNVGTLDVRTKKSYVDYDSHCSYTYQVYPKISLR